MNGSMELQLAVSRRGAVALDVLEFELHADDGDELPSCHPGAHIDVVTGAGFVRQYSLCGDINSSRADSPFTVRIASTGTELAVPADRSIVDVLIEAGVDVLTSCEEGTCGTCETAVLHGRPDHRDSVLSQEERAAGDRILPCVSRSHTPQLTLDL